MKEDLLNSLPQEVREQLQWRVTKVESYAASRNFVKATSFSTLQQRGEVKSNVNTMDETELGTVSSGHDLPAQ